MNQPTCGECDLRMSFVCATNDVAWCRECGALGIFVTMGGVWVFARSRAEARDLDGLRDALEETVLTLAKVAVFTGDARIQRASLQATQTLERTRPRDFAVVPAGFVRGRFRCRYCGLRAYRMVRDALGPVLLCAGCGTRHGKATPHAPDPPERLLPAQQS